MPRSRVTGRVRAVSLAIAAGSLALVGTASGATARPAPLEGIPAYQHVVVLTEENESASTTFAPGSPATYLNSLKSKGVFLPNYYGTGDASLDNYISMVSGQEGNAATNGDCLGLSLMSASPPPRHPPRHPGATWATSSRAPGSPGPATPTEGPRRHPSVTASTPPTPRPARDPTSTRGPARPHRPMTTPTATSPSSTSTTSSATRRAARPTSTDTSRWLRRSPTTRCPSSPSSPPTPATTATTRTAATAAPVAS